MAQHSSAPNGSTKWGVSDSALSGSRDVAWYVKELKDIPDAAREVLEGYSKIPPEKVHDHIYQVVCEKSTNLRSRGLTVRIERNGLGYLALSLPRRMAFPGP